MGSAYLCDSVIFKQLDHGRRGSGIKVHKLPALEPCWLLGTHNCPLPEFPSTKRVPSTRESASPDFMPHPLIKDTKVQSPCLNWGAGKALAVVFPKASAATASHLYLVRHLPSFPHFRTGVAEAPEKTQIHKTPSQIVSREPAWNKFKACAIDLYHKLPLQITSVDFAYLAPQRYCEMNHEVLKNEQFPNRTKKCSWDILGKVIYFHVNCGPRHQFLKVNILCSLLQNWAKGLHHIGLLFPVFLLN